MFRHYRQSIWNMLVWLISVSYCSVAVWPDVAGSTKCILMFLCVTWHRHWYIWLLYVADGYVAYCSVAVWPAVAGSTKCVLMFLCVTWHRHWYIWLLYVFLSWCNWYDVTVTTWQQTTRNTNTKYSTQHFKIKWLLCDKFQNSSLLEVRYCSVHAAQSFCRSWYSFTWSSK